MSHDTEDWAAVGSAVRDRKAQLKMSTARLARESGLSETTIRSIGNPGLRNNRSSLVAISAVLRWRYDYLINILLGNPGRNSGTVSPLEQRLSRIDRRLDALMARTGSDTKELPGRPITPHAG